MLGGIYRCFPHQIGMFVGRTSILIDSEGRIQPQRCCWGSGGLLLAFPFVGVGVLHRFDRGVLLFPRTDVFATHGYPKITNWTNLGSRD